MGGGYRAAREGFTRSAMSVVLLISIFFKKSIAIICIKINQGVRKNTPAFEHVHISYLLLGILFFVTPRVERNLYVTYLGGIIYINMEYIYASVLYSICITQYFGTCWVNVLESPATAPDSTLHDVVLFADFALGSSPDRRVCADHRSIAT